MMSQALAVVAGYALGTLQVLTIDWVRRRRDHKIRIRALLAELLRLQRLRKKFNWGVDGPADDYIPKPPKVTSAFAGLVTSTDFHLTDVFEGDNSQTALLTILDGCEVLQETHGEVNRRLDALRIEKDASKRTQLREEAGEAAGSYDERIDVLQFSVESAIEDLNGRLNEARYPRQLIRQVRRLPQGENPPDVSVGDKRLTGQ